MGLLALSDGIDGWLARKMGTTRSGAFLDPLADKVVVLGALFALVAKGIVWWLPVALIAVREIAMSVYRSVVGRHGVSIPARNSAKVKTLLQDLAIGLCLAPPLAGHDRPPVAAIWVAAAMTVFTGAQYYVDGRRARAGLVLPLLRTPATAPVRRPEGQMRVEIVAVGTELLLGQITDTNSQWMGEHLAAAGVASHFHQTVGDNHQRMVLAFRTALARSDGVIVCGGLGPDPRRHHPRGHRRGDERQARARDESLVAGIRTMFAEPGTGDARHQSPAGRRARRGHRSSPRPRGPPPGSSAQSGTRSSMRSPACPTRWPTCSNGASCPTCSAA